MTELIATPTLIRRDERGTFVEVLAEGTWEAVIHGRMRAGAVMGNHYHRITRIFFYLVSGKARIDLVRVEDGVGERTELVAEEGMYLEPEQAHAIRFLTPSEFILLKSRRYNPDDDDTFPYAIAESD